MTNKEYEDYLKTPKWRAIALKRMEIDKNKCVMCQTMGTKTNPLEVHHLSYKHLGNEENRIYEDLVTLCHVCHKSTHNLMNRVTNAQGRRGWSNNQTIPKVSVYTISGADLEYKEVNDNE